MEKSIHWADFTAERIIKQHGDKEQYVLASGITPSGTVHFGNFRESITVDFVARALRDKGKKVRFIFSWDDYDTFRKIPKNMPQQDLLHKYLYQPIVDTPDVLGETGSYAAYNEQKYEAQLKKVGIAVEYIYQSRKYRNGDYTNGIKKALQNRSSIMEILNKYRTSPLPSDWMPVSVYCQQCNRDDAIKNITYDGNNSIGYHCQHCNFDGTETIDKSRNIKLPWRIDWPMRWVYEGVDFEPGGKDHSSEGGSYTTAKEIVAQIYGGTPPIYLQYDFVSVKGRGGKMSSSSGDVVTVNDVLKIYEPEMVRWIFASYKSNVDFAVSFDLDVIKLYEDFDRQERIAYGNEQANEKKQEMALRVYQLSQIETMPSIQPFQPSFRHLCNILQINDGKLEQARSFYQTQITNERDERRFTERARCALFWLENYAPEDFKFRLNDSPPPLNLTGPQKDFLQQLTTYLEQSWEAIDDDKQLHEKIYDLIKQNELSPNDVFVPLYQILISKDKGPKLAGFIRIIGKERILTLFRQLL